MKIRSTGPASFLLPQWLRAPALSFEAAKEFRELLPYWGIAMVTSLVWLIGWPAASEGQGMAWAFYLVGELAVVAMGAASFGHEFSHRTMALTLSQPRTRQAVWWLKMRVLGLAMVLVLLVRLAGPVLHGNAQAIFEFAGLMSIAALAYGLLVAPLFALWSRSTLAATVFTVALPLVTWQGASLVAAMRHGVQNLDAAVVRETISSLFLIGMVVSWLLGPFLGYYTLRRLQAMEPWGRAIRLPQLVRRTGPRTANGPRRRGAWLALARKELRLLTPVYVIAGLYLLLTIADLALRRGVPEGPAAAAGASSLLGIATLIYGVLVSLLSGSLACAEDRHAGTLPWQLVQPVPVWQQWLVKAAVALAVALVLAVGLPLLLLPAVESQTMAANFWSTPRMGYALAAGQVLALGTLALYISTLTGSTMRAMLWAAPIGLALETITWGLLDSPALRSDLWNWFVPFETEGRSLASTGGVAWVLFWGGAVAGAFLTVLACACGNFRSLEQRASRVATHVGVFAGYLLLAGMACLSFKSVASATGFSLPLREQTLEELQAAACSVNVAEIENAVNQWALARDHHVPGTLAELTNELASPQVLVCPADHARETATNWATWNPGQVTYRYVPLTGPTSPAWTAELDCPVHATTTIVGTVLGRYGLSTNEASAEEGRAQGPGSNAWRMDARMLRRYGLLPYPTRPPHPRPPGGTNAVALPLVP